MRIADGEGVEQHSLRSAKDHCIGTDAERQRGYGDRRKQRIARQLTRPELHIPAKGRKREKATRVAMPLAQQGGIAKLTAGHLGGLFQGHALTKITLGEQLQMRLQLIVKLAMDPGLRKQGLQFCNQDAQPAAGAHPCLSSRKTRPITPDMRSQFSLSTANCFRPRLVME